MTRPWRLTRRKRVEMEAALMVMRARVETWPTTDSLAGAMRALRVDGWEVMNRYSLMDDRWRWLRVLRARVAIALRAALRADEDARCEEALDYAQGEAANVVGRPAPATGHLLGACGLAALSALDAIREWPALLWTEDRVPLALWEVGR